MFTITATHQRARAGVLHTSKGEIPTPFYMPVGTKGALKDLSPDELAKTGTQCLIANSFLLSLKPGADIIADHGGLHNYMQWEGGIFTDSGGFQILLDQFFIAKTTQGIKFRNPFTGSVMELTPAQAIHMQHRIGSDVAMALDDVARYGVSHQEATACMERSHRWLTENIDAHQRKDDRTNPRQMLFGIAQGGVYSDLREESARRMIQQDVDGFGIGGLAIGEPADVMSHAIDIQTSIMEQVAHKPRYIMGLGSPVHVIQAVRLGADMFDSIFPTQCARRGSLFTSTGVLRITNARYATDLKPIEQECSCLTCAKFTRSYVHHMLRLGERIGWRLASIHNITFLQRILAKCRKSIIDGTFNTVSQQLIDSYKE